MSNLTDNSRGSRPPAQTGNLAISHHPPAWYLGHKGKNIFSKSTDSAHATVDDMSKANKTPRIFDGAKVRLATSTKHDGHTSFSHVSDEETESNINRFVQGLGWNDKSRAFIRIRYGDDRTYHSLEIINDGNKPPRQFLKMYAFDVDALMTNLPGVALLLPTADCYPVTIVDPSNKILALNHLGWQSTTAHLLEKTITNMNKEYGSKPEDLLVHIGPGIPARYYVFKELAQLELPGWGEHLHQTDDGYEVDLLSYNLEQLSLAGVDGKHIEIDTRNTAESDELESHYMHNKSGKPVARRFITAVMMAG